MKLTVGESIDQLYETYGPEEIIDLYRTAARSTEDAIAVCVGSEHREGHDFILEGLHLEPALAAHLVQVHGAEVVRPLFLVRTDPEAFLRDVPKSTTPFDWILAQASTSSTRERIAAMICRYGEEIRREAEQHSLPTLVMDEHFDDQVERGIAALLSDRPPAAPGPSS